MDTGDTGRRLTAEQAEILRQLRQSFGTTPRPCRPASRLAVWVGWVRRLGRRLGGSG
jgi:hypothetical protein